ncbi:hypothetical protein BC830DRAFT_135396 [Chytriomyces sp. MP71]|nr:hypothetical protein BC830DRAFT_135396 [Chytriomyces sp. MP71]
MIYILVLGTRGDLLPALALAVALQRRGHRAHIVTHDDHLSLVRGHGIGCTGSGTHSSSGGGSASDQDRDAEKLAVFNAVKRDVLFVIATLFCVAEASAAADRFNVKWAAFSPFVATDFGLASMGEFWDKVRESDLTGTVHSAIVADPEWKAAVEHWLWRLFLHDVGQFREAVGLPSWPQFDYTARPPFLLYAIPASLAELAALPLDATFARFCGQWTLPSSPVSNPRASIFAQHSSLTRFIEKQNEKSRKILHVGFGSMDTLHPCLARDAGSVATIVDSIYTALLQTNLAAIWIVDASMQGCALRDYLLAKTNTLADRICVLPGPVDHALLFSSGLIRGSVHHGGIGTLTEVLRSGMKQVIVPYMFDQEKWGLRLMQEGVSKCFADVDPEFITVAEWVGAFNWISGDADLDRIQDWKVKLAVRDSSDQAVDLAVLAVESLLMKTPKT